MGTRVCKHFSFANLREGNRVSCKVIAAKTHFTSLQILVSHYYCYSVWEPKGPPEETSSSCGLRSHPDCGNSYRSCSHGRHDIFKDIKISHVVFFLHPRNRNYSFASTISGTLSLSSFTLSIVNQPSPCSS